MKTLNDFLNEGGYNDRSTAILPATRALFNKNKVSIHDIANEPDWNEHELSVQIAHVHKSHWEAKHGNKPKVHFIVGYGHTKEPVGHEFTAHHDQTGAKLGHHTVVNVVHLKGGKIVHKANDLHIDDKAAVHVYK